MLNLKSVCLEQKGEIIMTHASVLRVTFLILLFSVGVEAQETKPYSPYVGQDFPNNVYFGDTHLHTSLSFDAFPA
jgi:hypothetical protein